MAKKNGRESLSKQFDSNGTKTLTHVALTGSNPFFGSNSVSNMENAIREFEERERSSEEFIENTVQALPNVHNERGDLAESLEPKSNDGTKSVLNQSSKLLFEVVWHKRNGWNEQLQGVIGELIELNFVRDGVWTRTRAELDSSFVTLRKRELIAGRFQYKNYSKPDCQSKSR